MTAKEFFDLVVLMREAQKEYFKYRMSSDLNKSKKLEKRVDDEIDRVKGILNGRNEPKLF